MQSKSILGCFVSFTSLNLDGDTKTEANEKEFRDIFLSYISGEKSISYFFQRMIGRYGEDLDLILFEFYLNPSLLYLKNPNKIGSYRKKEKSFSIPIFVIEEDFFRLTDLSRRKFLAQSVIEGFDLLKPVIIRRKLNIEIDLIKSNAISCLSEFQ